MKTKRVKSSNLLRLLDLANEVYDDGFLGHYYTRNGKLKHGGAGDTLAKFIVVELIETFDANASWKRQLLTATRAMESARYQLQDIEAKFEETYERL